ncbi:MAG: bifunctional [glutamate--ammonia ligase]-adenylyl-L-tyrosine phosphorylase/[glutamate--ammonia-ligase] adenylyltransferase [Polyangiaceae bacterium]|nr:bifunctional [glutamate--ammonia ligase]-adenylyl-L-tyrosine phosphorylase/[glutamate--ammonia-ligase] adenylyltransferase [Polyangiaceae bacterium]
MPTIPSVPPAVRHDLGALAETIDPHRAADLLRTLGSAAERQVAVLLATAFPAMRPVHAWQAEALERIATDGWRTPRDTASFRQRLERALWPEASPGWGIPPEEHVDFPALRRVVWVERARIALREILPQAMGGASVLVTAAELSHLADAIFEVLLVEARQKVAARFGEPVRADGRPSSFVVLGMGKLGGRELNAGSDVDVVFFYDTDESGNEYSLHEHWTRVAQRIVAVMDEPTADGLIWRVDLRLRPEGSRGPLVNSLGAAERYYETWGRLWERAALLRARPIAGDLHLGAQMDAEVVTPFVYRRSVDPGIVSGLADLVARSRAELSRAPARDLKLGPGGIREAEFFVQTLQLVWGGRDPALRVRGTMEALARLRAHGFVTEREGRAIDDAFVLLRSAEHAVQWARGTPTHELPSDPGEFERLARTLGFVSSEAFAAALHDARATVGELFASLAPGGPATGRSRSSEIVALLAADDEERLAAAVERRFGVDITEHLQSLARRPDGLLGEATRERHLGFAERVLDAIEDSANPGQAAQYLRSFFQRLFVPGVHITGLVADEHALRRLVRAFGASEFVGDALVARPDLADLVLGGGGGIPDPRTVVRAEIVLWQRTSTSEADPEDLRAGFVAATRRAKLWVTVAVAVADLADQVETREATSLLSDLATEILDQAVHFELGGDARGLSVIAMGKLGGRDIGYGSDLDVLFIYDPASAPRSDEAAAYFTKRAQRIMRLIQEPSSVTRGYELDTRLRPSGSQGLLVTSLRSFARYHGVVLPSERPDGSRPSNLASGAAWERQALLRARACAGDRDLGERVIAVAHEAAYENGAVPAGELHHLRRRMERELGREHSGRFDLKLGHGGLLDVEFAVQWLQMRHGEDPAVRTSDTMTALVALRDGGYLAVEAFETFRDGYHFLRRLEQRIHVTRGRSASALDVSERSLGRIARAMGFANTGEATAAQTLLARYRDVTEANRRTYREVLGVSE